MADNLERALGAWREILGRERVIVDPELLQSAAQATFPTHREQVTLLQPTSAEEVREILRIAAGEGIAVYPVSGGKNWGYGSKVPTADDTALLDLSRMNRVIELNEELGYVVVEPGVTFRQLYETLQERGSDLMMSVPGTTPDASVLGNAIERGLGFGPHVERFSNVADMEIMLSTGEVIHTGYSRFSGARCAHVHRWGVGPTLGPMFSQSNFGVVTRMTMWLTRRPAFVSLITFTVEDNDSLEALAPTIRRCKGPRIDLRIQNGARHRVTSRGDVSGARAWVSRTVLGPPSKWHGTIALYAESALEAHATYRRLRSWLQPATGPKVRHLRHWGGLTQLGAKALEAPLGRIGLTGASSLANMGSSLWGGRPQDAAVIPTYAAMGVTPSSERPDMDRDRCGLLWLCPVVPLLGEDLRHVVDSIDAITDAHGFVPQVNLRILSPRVTEAIVGLTYDRSRAGQDEAAVACHDALFEALTSAGYLPYRLGLQSMNRLPASSDDSAAVMQRLKQALDPAHIISPGRYVD
jgi:FAD/FMN-containing dehydrogenase